MNNEKMTPAELSKADKRARQFRETIRHFNTRSPIEKVVEVTVNKDNAIKIPRAIMQNHVKVGRYDKVCIFLTQDGSLLVMEKGMAEERLGREYGAMLQSITEYKNQI